MLYDENKLQLYAALIVAAGKQLYENGWAPATSSNFSMRLSDTACAITISGKHKGELTTGDIMAVDMEGIPLQDAKPSAETLLHTQLYKRDPDIGAILHTHSPNATILSLKFPESSIVFEGYELQKAFRGVLSHEEQLIFPIFDNSQDIPMLARQVERWMDKHGTGHGYLIRGHGLYIWGKDMNECLLHLEALELLLECEWRIFSARTRA